MAHPEVTIDYTSGSSADTSSFSASNPAQTITVYGAGTITLKDNAATPASVTYTVSGGEVIVGEWTVFTSTTCSRIRMSTSNRQPVPPPVATLVVAARMGTSGAQTNATATMANLVDLTLNLSAGAKIAGTLTLWANNSTAGEGLAFDLNGGSATFTSIEFGFAATPKGATVGTATSTAIGTAVTCTTVATSDACYTISFVGVVNAAGTLIPRFAEVSHSTGTATVEINSAISVWPTSN